MFSKLLLRDASSRETSYFLNPEKREPDSGIAVNMVSRMTKTSQV